MSRISPRQVSRKEVLPFHCLALYGDSLELPAYKMSTVLQGGPGGTVVSSGRLALTFQEGCISALSSALIRITKSPLVSATGPLSCVLLTTFRVPVLLWSSGPLFSRCPLPGSSLSLSAVNFPPAYSLKVSVLQDHLLVCLSFCLSIYPSSIYSLSHHTHLDSFHHPQVCARDSPELQTYPSTCLHNFSI